MCNVSFDYFKEKIMADKNNNFGLSLKDMGADNSSDADIDKLLTENNDVPDTGLEDDKNQETEIDDDFIDFNDFSIDDLDTALSKYGDDDLGETFVEDDESAGSADNKSSDTNENELMSMQTSVNVDKTSTDDNDSEKNSLKEPSNETKVSATVGMPKVAEVSLVDKSDNGEYSQENLDKHALGNLVWYDDTLNEKVYEISLNNMPEFLDYDNSIKTIHVNIESPYGWNVFFENGVFMNLMDLKEYQERHGNLPGHNGKIIYGNRMSSFGKIDRIVVYSKPRYFAYGLKK